VDDCTLHIMEIPSQLYACDNCSVVYLRILDLYLGPRPAANDCTNCTLWNSFSASGMVEHNSLQCPSGVWGEMSLYIRKLCTLQSVEKCSCMIVNIYIFQ